MDLKKIAMIFNHTVTSFCELLGYSRQGLYQMTDGTNGICTPRYYASMKLLKYESDKMYEKDLEFARMKKQERENTISDMCYKAGAINVIEHVEQN